MSNEQNHEAIVMAEFYRERRRRAMHTTVYPTCGQTIRVGDPIVPRGETWQHASPCGERE